jgi:hypothetical protein
MNLSKRLVLNGAEVNPSVARVHLGLNEVGYAEFQVPVPPGAAKGMLAEYFLGIGGGTNYMVLVGPVVAVIPARDSLTVRVRELSAVLDFPHMFYLRNQTAREVIAAIERKTGLRFILPVGASYLDERRHLFQSQGTCRDALDRMAGAWDIPSAVWTQLPDGMMYWGHWQAGPFTKTTVPIDPRLVVEHDRERKKIRLPAIPALRPGMVVTCEFRFRIDRMEFDGDNVLLFYTQV